MKVMTVSVAVAAMLVLVQSAQAREHHRQHRHHVAHLAQHYLPQQRDGYAAPDRFAESGQGYPGQEYAGAGAYRGHLGGRPSAWCGWQMRQLVGGDPGSEFNLARNWAHWGHAGPVGVGAVVVWPHHVGKIVGEEAGEWVVESGNDGHRLRTRPRSLAGVIAVRWG
jgi:hypothetical protein